MSYHAPYLSFFGAVNNEVNDFNKALGNCGNNDHVPRHHVHARGHHRKGGRHGRKASGRELHKKHAEGHGEGRGDGHGELTADLDNWFGDDDWSLLPSDDLDVALITPPVDLLEHDDSYELNVTIPGVKEKKSINVEYHKEKNQIIIFGEVPSVVTKENKDKIKVQEVASGSFKRVISLPGYPGIDADNIKADYSSGVLSLDIPKLKPAEPNDSVQKIPVSSQDSWSE
ncbi:related to HSP26-Heat shock protein [Zygosaccharomyces bailii ISA1307]|nr:related to HSP26-Heat shock protein [Zygosaccharomyces bailii ISA1307]